MILYFLCLIYGTKQKLRKIFEKKRNCFRKSIDYAYIWCYDEITKTYSLTVRDAAGRR